MAFPSYLQEIDTDGSGFIDAQEIMAALKDCGVDLGQAEAIIKEVDKDGNGVIDYDEFALMVGERELVRRLIRTPPLIVFLLCDWQMRATDDDKFNALAGIGKNKVVRSSIH